MKKLATSLLMITALTAGAATYTSYTNLTAATQILSDDAVIIYRGTNPPYVLRGSNLLGLLIFTAPQTTNCCGSGTTNLASYSIPAHTLTNSGDGLRFIAGGRMANATASTNQLQVTYGSQTLFDTGAIRNSNTVWRIRGEIIRTGDTNAIAVIEGLWSGGGTHQTTNIIDLAVWQTNGIATALTIFGGSTKPAGMTQEVWRVERMR